MRSLTPQQIVQAWELGASRHSLDRALLLLALADPARDAEELSRLPIGRRDGLLLDLHQATFGPELSGCLDCESCGETLEFSLPVGSLKLPAPDDGDRHELIADGETFRFRLPDSRDLGAAAGSRTLVAARDLVVERCLLAPAQLSPAQLDALAAKMAALDPQAELVIDLDCEACGAHTQSLLDVAGFLWIEVAAEAKRLLREVHILATAYGWRESEVLSLGPQRRHFYIGLASA